jgi:hypothetical protein
MHLTVKPSVARTLPETVLRRSGWAKGAGGTGNVHTKHPLDVWEEMGAWERDAVEVKVF